MKKTSILIAFYVIFSCGIISAQETPIPQTPSNNPNIAPKDFNSFKERLYFGGNVGAWFGSTTYINLSPLVGVKITKKFSVGAGVTYNYFSQTYQGQKYTSTIYGGSAFARYFVMDNLFLQGGWDRLSVVNPASLLPGGRTWVDNILLGGGYRQAFSERGNFVAAIFYNVNQTPLSPYPNPIIQLGFTLGL